MKKLILALFLPLWAATGLAAQWSTHGPGTVLINTEARFENAPIPEPGSGRRISFDPATSPGDYWCSTRLEFDPAIPERKVTFYVRATPATTVHFKVMTADGRDLYRDVAVGDDWSKVMLDFSTECTGLQSFEVIFLGSWPATVIDLADVAFRADTARPELAKNWMPAAIPAPVPGYRIETTIHSCWRNNDNEFSGINTPEGRAMALDITRKLQAEYGDLSVAVNFFGPGLTMADAKKFVADMNELGVIVLSEGHDNASQEELAAHDAFAINIRGERWDDPGHNGDKTHPYLLKQLHDKLRFSAEAGAAVYRSVDYIWPHFGGPIWGYSDAAFQRWVEDLTGTDAKLEVVEADGSRRLADFPEYFASYYGFTMQPADCGLTSWHDYRPPALTEPDSPQRRNKHKVFVALYHYEWLKFLNESVRPYDALGMRAQPTLNPESQYNGTDLYWMLKSSLTRGWCTEWWYAANVIVPVYYHAMYYGNVANKFNKEIIHLGESGAAGNGFGAIPNYWDNMTNYLVTYVKSAASDAKVMNDQYWAATFEHMTDPAHEAPYEMYTAFRSAWSGFLQSKHDRAMKPAGRVLVIQNRAVMDNVDPFDNGGGAAPLSVARDLIEQNFLYDGAAFPLDDAYDLEAYDCIVHTPFETPQDFNAQLHRWLLAKPGRTLITHSDVPNRIAGPVVDLAAADAPFRTGDGARELGLPELTAGQIISGVLAVNDPTVAAALQPFDGREVKFPEALSLAPGGRVLAAVGQTPLLSEFAVGDSRILYLHNKPITTGLTGRQLQQALIRAALNRAGEKPQATAPESHRVLVFDRADTTGKVVVIFNTESNTNMLRDGAVFRVYQAQNPEAVGAVQLATDRPGGRFRLTDMLTGETAEATADADGGLPLSYTGWDLRGWYVDPLE